MSEIKAKETIFLQHNNTNSKKGTHTLQIYHIYRKIGNTKLEKSLKEI